MRRGLLSLWLLFGVVASAGWATSQVGAAPADGAHRSVRAEIHAGINGKHIWLRDCAVCHGSNAAGGANGPDIRHAGPALVDFMVTAGYMPLPAPGAKLTRRTSPYSAPEQRALVRYASTLVKGLPIPQVDIAGADLGAGGHAYHQNCATCHQTTGAGGALAFGKNAPSLAHATPTQVVEAMRTGPGAMPKFGETAISAEQADQIAAYVRYLHSPNDAGGINLGHFGPVPEGLIAWVFGLGALIVITRLLGRPRRKA